MSQIEANLLKNRHNICLETNKDAEYFVLAGNQPEDGFNRLLERFGGALQNRDRRVAASLFIKRYCSLIAGAVYVWTHHEHGLDLSFHKVKISVDGTGLKFLLTDTQPLKAMNHITGEEHRNALYLKHLFQDHVSPLFQLTAERTRIRETSLWSTLSYLLAYWKREWLNEAQTDQIKRRIDAFYRILMDEPPDSFPGKDFNPLNIQFRTVEVPWREGSCILIRDACCMNYRAFGEDSYCYTCPLISDETRIEKYLAAHTVNIT